MKGLMTVGALVVVAVIVIAASSAFFVVQETEQVIITRFGKPVREAIAEPGLHIRTPFIERVNRFERRFLEWDGDPNQLPTRDKRFIFVDTYARWRVTDPLKYYQRLRDERGAQSRLDDILDGETRNTVASHDLIEVVRSSNREFAMTEELGGEGQESFAEIQIGRQKLAAEVLAAANAATGELGIEVLDFRFKRINYVPEVRQEVYQRMISERNRIAERFRSEGAGEAARINGERERELANITSAAYKDAQGIKGKADARAADVYANAYNGDPDFYRFLKTMESYETTIDADTTLILSTSGEFLRYLERAK
jgi:membrane protease subunit HflC